MIVWLWLQLMYSTGWLIYWSPSWGKHPIPGGHHQSNPWNPLVQSGRERKHVYCEWQLLGQWYTLRTTLTHTALHSIHLSNYILTYISAAPEYILPRINLFQVWNLQAFCELLCIPHLPHIVIDGEMKNSLSRISLHCLYQSQKHVPKRELFVVFAAPRRQCRKCKIM